MRTQPAWIGLLRWGGAGFVADAAPTAYYGTVCDV